jgi:hypothetical protein
MIQSGIGGTLCKKLVPAEIKMPCFPTTGPERNNTFSPLLKVKLRIPVSSPAVDIEPITLNPGILLFP